MRLTVLLAVVALVSVADSGCLRLIFECKVHNRTAVWTQDDVPVRTRGKVRAAAPETSRVRAPEKYASLCIVNHGAYGIRNDISPSEG